MPRPLFIQRCPGILTNWKSLARRHRSRTTSKHGSDARRAHAIQELEQLQSALSADGQDQEDGDVTIDPGSELTRLASLARDEQNEDSHASARRGMNTPAVYLGGGVKAASKRRHNG